MVGNLGYALPSSQFFPFSLPRRQQYPLGCRPRECILHTRCCQHCYFTMQLKLLKVTFLCLVYVIG
ncbi:hypothetical protein RvY_05461 [Ramazzottius varieornatus]|uniref:Uncharacterized protein n=1 Tax=Ramazzottius varieornatus TaxID=947166 RepID=A0A1D1UYQ2_RAMVA|nr:hypothetical protein RvY_05461 [Ramazzottius varieornatus]